MTRYGLNSAILHAGRSIQDEMRKLGTKVVVMVIRPDKFVSHYYTAEVLDSNLISAICDDFALCNHPSNAQESIIEEIPHTPFLDPYKKGFFSCKNCGRTISNKTINHYDTCSGGRSKRRQ